MMKKIVLVLGVFVVIAGQVCAGQEQKPIRVLIFSGSNNHNWKETTPCLQKIYADSGRFVADVLDDPSKCTAEILKKYDVVVSNWTAFPKVNGRQWGENTEKALMDFVRSGKGFAVIHAASTCFNGWVEYHQMVGATWGKNTGHGSIHQFEVNVTDKEHPITKGMKDFQITDELWHRMETLQPTESQKVLCKAYSDKDKGGSGQMEKVAMYSKFGKGRCFYNILGHDVRAMKSAGWKQLMLRGTEWAATGKVAVKADGKVSKVKK